MSVYYAFSKDNPYEDLCHHGVAGQKWGVRNGPPYPVQAGTKVRIAKSKMTKATKAQYKAEGGSKGEKSQKNVAKSMDRERLLKRPVHITELSDDQLRDRINRLKLEQEYKKLLKGDPDAKAQANKGKSYFAEEMSKVGAKVLATGLEIGLNNWKQGSNRANARRDAYNKLRAQRDAKEKDEKKAKKGEKGGKGDKSDQDKVDTGRTIIEAALDDKWDY